MSQIPDGQPQITAERQLFLGERQSLLNDRQELRQFLLDQREQLGKMVAEEKQLLRDERQQLRIVVSEDARKSGKESGEESGKQAGKTSGGLAGAIIGAVTSLVVAWIAPNLMFEKNIALEVVKSMKNSNDVTATLGELCRRHFLMRPYCPREKSADPATKAVTKTGASEAGALEAAPRKGAGPNGSE